MWSTLSLMTARHYGSRMWAFKKILLPLVAIFGLFLSPSAWGGNFSFWKQNNSGPLTFNWTGLAGDNNWSNTGNWSSHVVPGSSDVPQFNNIYCTGTNCNANVDVNATMAGISIASGYTGTITQNTGISMSIGSTGWSQAGGTFVGGTADITITSSQFSLSGGSFTSTTGNLKILAASGAGYTVFSQTGGTFLPSNGTVYLSIDSAGCVNNTHYVIDVNSTLTLNNLRYAGGHPSAANLCYWDLGVSDSLTLTGSFNTTRDFAAGTIASSGTINVQGDLTYGTGTNSGTLVVNMTGTGTQNISQTAGTTTPSGLFTINKASGSVLASSAISLASSLTNTAGTLDTGGHTFAISGTMNVAPGASMRETIVTQISAGTWGLQLGCNWEEYGAGGMTLIWAGANCNYTINKAGYTVTLAGASSFNKDFVIAAGTFNPAGYTLSVAGNWTNSGTYTPSTTTLTLNGTNQTISGNNTFYGLTKNATSAQTLTFASGSTQNITNSLSLTGTSAGARLSLRSSTPGTQWNINASGTRTLSYLDVQDSDNTNATAMAAGTTSVDSGNNINWTFGIDAVWTGLAGDNKWSTPGNWSPSGVPSSTAVVQFNGTSCSGLNCNATVDGNITVGGVVLTSTYAGTITQGAGFTMAIGASGWNQSAGTFVGGTADITLTSSSFTLSGGSFTSTSANLKIAALSGAGYTVFTQSGGTFTPNAGTLYFTDDSTGCVNGTTYTIDVNSTLTLANLRYAGGHPSAANSCTWALAAGDSLTVTGNFDMTRDLAAGLVAATGTINVGGNLNFGTGSNGGTLILNINGTGTQNISQTAGTTVPSGQVTINKASGAAVTTTHWTLNSTPVTISAGTFQKGVNLNMTGGGAFLMSAGSRFRDAGGSTSVSSFTADPASTMELYGGGGGYSSSSTFGNFECNRTGTLTISSNLSVAGNFLIDQGTVSVGAFTLSVGGNWTNLGGTFSGTSTVSLNGTNQTISGSTSFYNLTKTASTARTLTVASGTTQTVTNTLTLTGTSLANRLSLRSGTPGTQWNINASGTRTLGFLDVEDSNNTNATAMAATDNSNDSGNNTNWTFNSITPQKTIFITSTSYNGNLGGVAGADAKCATQATAQSLTGTYKAWIAITTGTDDPATTFVHSAVPYKMVDGTTIANKWAGLTSASLTSAITLDETGAASGGAATRWTNVASNGTASSSGSGTSTNCTGWTVSTGSKSGRYGSPGSVTATWTDNGATNQACNTATSRLICVQQ